MQPHQRFMLGEQLSHIDYLDDHRAVNAKSEGVCCPFEPSSSCSNHPRRQPTTAEALIAEIGAT